MGVVKYTKEVIKEAKRVRWPKKRRFLIRVTHNFNHMYLCSFSFKTRRSNWYEPYGIFKKGF
jgi:hypothetical protein